MPKGPKKTKSGKGKSRPVKPILQAMLLADRVYKDATTGKSVIAGTFNALMSRRFPSEFGQKTYAFICLTAVRGEVPILLRYVDLSNDEVLLEFGPVQIRASDPLSSIDFSIPVPPIPMPHAGGFAFEIHSCDELLGSLRVTVHQMDNDQGDEGEKQ